MCKKFALFPSVNVLGGKLRPCSNDPITGFLEMAFVTHVKETTDLIQYAQRFPMIF